ncbi:WGR domain-containing protein [Pararhodobacter sp.]|uniref:WGR domain-containing protein n=1 Tax=Pararhodobacter sp. TaxID=2127056 RepID=UPI002FE41BEE
MHRSLERRDAPENIDRFYRIDLGRDLFGQWCVTRGWGRNGTYGRQKIVSFPSARDAVQAFRALEAAKRRRGYVARG